MARENKGKVPSGSKLFCNLLDSWSVYQVTDTDYRVVADRPVEGKANYSVMIESHKILAKRDRSILKRDRPEVYAALDDFLAGKTTEELGEGTDKFGDLSVNRGRALTPEQEWNRSLMWIRQKRLTTRDKSTLLDPSKQILLFFQSCFKREPTTAEMDAARAYLLPDVAVDEEALRDVIMAYIAGAYKPLHMAGLESQFDLLTGKGVGFEPAEDDLKAFR